MVIDYSVTDSGIFTEGCPQRGKLFRASNEEFEIQKISCGWNFYFFEKRSVWNFFGFCLYKWSWFILTQKIGLFSFYLVHYKFYSKAHMIKLQFNLSIQNIVFVDKIVIHRDSL